MNAVYEFLSEIHLTLKSDETITGLVGRNIWVGPQRPLGKKNPVVLIFAEAAESSSVGVIHNAFVSVVARSDSGDGEGTQLANIFNAIDDALNDKFLSCTGASGRLHRGGIPVPFGTYDDMVKDYFKHWRYRVAIKTISH